MTLFAIGGVMLWGLFLAPRAVSPPAPREASWGVPRRPLRFVSHNILHNQRGIANVVAQISAIQPDFILLQEIESRDLIELAARLGMALHHHPRHYERSSNLAGRRATWGNFILSKHPLYDAGSIPNPHGGSFGVWATAVVDDRKFLIANVHLSATLNANHEFNALVKAWRDRGSPPIVIGGDFNGVSIDSNDSRMTRDFRDALAWIGKSSPTRGDGAARLRGDYFLCSNEWRPLDGGVVESGASDHDLIWIDAAGASSAGAATGETTRPATSPALPAARRSTRAGARLIAAAAPAGR